MPSHSPGSTTSRCKTTCSFSNTTSPPEFSKLGYVNRNCLSVLGTCSDPVLSRALLVVAVTSISKTVLKARLRRILFSRAVALRVLRNDVRFGSLADPWTNSSLMSAFGSQAVVHAQRLKLSQGEICLGGDKAEGGPTVGFDQRSQMFFCFIMFAGVVVPVGEAIGSRSSGWRILALTNQLLLG